MFVDTPLAVAEERDVKGLYTQGPRGRAEELHRHRLALRGPGDPELRIDTTTTTPEQAAELIVDRLRAMGVLG